MYLVIKIIGCILLVSATTLMGFKKAQRLYKRRDFINDFLLYKGLANAHLDDSKNEIKQKSRLYKTMGFFVGTAAALVII